MVLLNLGALSLGMAARVPLGGDDGVVYVRRWMLRLAAPVALAAALFIYKMDGRLTLLEKMPPDARILSLDQRVTEIEKLVKLYEELRMQRERQIAELQTEVRNLQSSIDLVNAKLDRVLFPMPRRSDR